MSRYLVGRVLGLLPVLLFISIVTFALMHSVKGGPWDSEQKLSDAVKENLDRHYGLDRPLWRQYLSFVGNAARGDLGVSFQRQDAPVTRILLKGLRVSAVLGGLALMLAIVTGIGLGSVAAVYRQRWPDHLGRVLSTAGAAVPSFCLAVLLVYVFAVRLHLFPVLGWGSVRQAVLPVITLAVGPAAFLARLTRASLLEVLHADYMRTARAKGLGGRSLVLGHGLRSMASPLITALGPMSVSLMTGSFIVERIFSIPGSGRLFVQSVYARDYGMIMGATVLFALLISVANLAADIACAAVDPRVRLGGKFA